MTRRRAVPKEGTVRHAIWSVLNDTDWVLSTEIAEKLGTTATALGPWLQAMKQKKILDSRKVGRIRQYRRAKNEPVHEKTNTEIVFDDLVAHGPGSSRRIAERLGMPLKSIIAATANLRNEGVAGNDGKNPATWHAIATRRSCMKHNGERLGSEKGALISPVAILLPKSNPEHDPRWWQ